MNASFTHPLSGYLQSRRWLRRSHPFSHIVAYDVFVPSVYDRLVWDFRQAVDNSSSNTYLDAHDIFGCTVGPALASRFEPFSLRVWHDLLAQVTGVSATGHVALGLHHHRVGSADGFPHNDVNPGWFAGDPMPGQIELSRPEIVDYTTGLARAGGVFPRETVRAVAALYYLGNGTWQPGDGGSTGLYTKPNDNVRNPAVTVPPLDNSLVIFECTPTSWHGFISNRRHPRNSIIMWLHRPKTDVVARWGAGAIVPYGRRPEARH